jgi:hypothetical protein
MPFLKSEVKSDRRRKQNLSVDEIALGDYFPPQFKN